MKLILFFLLTATLSFAQTNFNVKWENPGGTYFYNFGSWERNNSVPEIILRDASYNMSVYDGATKTLKYTYPNPDTSNFGDFYNTTNIIYNPIDVNNDGINEVYRVHSSYNGTWSSNIKILNGSNGQTLYDHTYAGLISYYTFDIDGDSYIEIIIVQSYITSSNYDDKHITILSTASHPISVDPESKTATKYSLGQNYPNPFNPTTTIDYSISQNANVKLLLFNEIGQLAGTYINQKQEAGDHKFILDGSNLSSGTYFYQIFVDDRAEAKKMVILK
jgi:hypothetical protein